MLPSLNEIDHVVEKGVTPMERHDGRRHFGGATNASRRTVLIVET